MRVNNLCTPSDDAFTVVSTAGAFMAIITTEVTTATDKAMRSIKLGGEPHYLDKIILYLKNNQPGKSTTATVKKILTNHIFGKNLVARIYKELLKLKKQNDRQLCLKK